LILVIAACKKETTIEVAPTSGTADFSRYISIGNSLTAGYADGGLYLQGQLNSFPSIIAQQMKLAGGGEFPQPLFAASQANGSGYLKYGGLTSTGSPNLIPVSDKLAYRGEGAFFTKFTGNNNNYGVPGIKLQHILYAPYGNLNPYFERLLPGNGFTNSNTTTYLDFVTAKPYTFFSNWLGNNDALGYATTGGEGDVLTPKADFTALYTALITKLTANGAKGVVATIPDVSTIAFLNTVTVAALLAGVKKVNPAVTTIYISTSAGPRAATAEDLVNLTFPTALLGTTTTANPYPYGLHPNNPVEGKYILDKAEVANAQDFVNSYNTTIKSVAEAKGLAILDAYAFLNTLKGAGIVYDGTTLNSSYISGKAFSLDGVHLTPMGYAVAANEFIKAINAKYGSTLPSVSLGNYTFLRFN
jgi:hypothetical protein